MLLGRHSQLRTLDQLLVDVRAGKSAALVIHGEAGIGKTALLDDLASRASGCTVARAAGIESEMELPYAGLHQLCAPMGDGIERLPALQRDALRTVFGMHDGDPPTHFLVGLAVLGLLSEAAAGRPLVCLVDDAHWLDHASVQALAVAARRMVAESVALVFAVRTPSEELAGLPAMPLEGLSEEDARELLDAALPTRLDARIRDRIVVEADGNPLALLEMPRSLTAGELAGGFGLPEAARARGVEEIFERRLRALPAATRKLLLLAAANPFGDQAGMRRAAERLGVGFEAVVPAIDAELVLLGDRLRFRHPLVRSAIYAAATVREKQEAHAALAAAIDPEADPDLHAMHRAKASRAPDEDVAAELERSAGRAQARGGVAASAAFLEHAVYLTSDASRRSQRAVAAAQAKHLAGAPDAARELLTIAEDGPLDELHRGRAELLRAQIAAARRGSEAPPLLLAAAQRLEPLDPAAARETYLELLTAAMFAEPLTSGVGLVDAARAARAAPPPPGDPLPSDLLLDGYALTIIEGHAAGAPLLKRALRGFQSDGGELLRWFWLANLTAMDLWDDEAWHVLSLQFVQAARDTGALALLPIALSSLSGLLINEGEIDAAASVIDEMEEVTDAVQADLGPYGALSIAAWQGDEAAIANLVATRMEEVIARGEGIGLTGIAWAQAFLHNCAGRSEEALEAGERAVEYPATLLYARWAQLELIEAAARGDRRERGLLAMDRLAETTQASGTEWAHGVEKRSRALLSSGEEAERLYREAIAHLERTRMRSEVARAHLLYGEWLRRERRRRDARAQLRIAYEMLAGMGAGALTDRAARELQATGETVRKRTATVAGELTSQEAEVARLARDGLSNPEIAARLFISTRTVEYHLHHVFLKLGITARQQLGSVLEPA